MNERMISTQTGGFEKYGTLEEISSTPEKEGDGYLFIVSDEKSPYYGKYHVKIDIEAKKCSVTQEKIK